MPELRDARARIAVNAIPLLGRLTGVGRYLHELIHQFEKLAPHYEYRYYYGYFSNRVLTGGSRIHRLKDLLTKLPLLRAGLRVFRVTVAKYHHEQFDLYFEPNFIPLDIKAKSIVATVHDFSFQCFPEAHPKDRVRYFAKNFRKNVLRANRVITDSAYTKTEAVEFLGIPAELITPIHLGVDHGAFKHFPREALDICRRELSLPDRFVLFVGTREPRKNLDRLLHAYAELPDSLRRDLSLVLVGPQGWGKNELDEKKLKTGVMIFQYLDVRKLAMTYNLASVFVYPSLYEGFGLPPLEAMACGCPVIASNVASIPEVCGGASYYVNPLDVQSIAEGLHRVLSDEQLRLSLIAKGMDRAQLFTWDETARKTLAVFNDAIGETK
jgi:glycosyltransferase involved in cell wall biosynthesis